MCPIQQESRIVVSEMWHLYQRYRIYAPSSPSVKWTTHQSRLETILHWKAKRWERLDRMSNFKPNCVTSQRRISAPAILSSYCGDTGQGSKQKSSAVSLTNDVRMVVNSATSLWVFWVNSILFSRLVGFAIGYDICPAPFTFNITSCSSSYSRSKGRPLL